MKIIYSNRRTVAIIIDHSGEVIVRAPRFVSKKQIMKFVNEKEDWIKEKCSQVKKPEELSLVPGAVMMFPDEPYSIDKTMRWAKKSAKEIISQRVLYYVNQNKILPTNLTFENIKISSAKTRWGSCSGKNSLNFSWKLALCPLDVIDYVVVHELCHIVHKNHGKQFWNMVKINFPEYVNSKKWLKANSSLLTFEFYSNVLK